MSKRSSRAGGKRSRNAPAATPAATEAVAAAVRSIEADLRSDDPYARRDALARAGELLRASSARPVEAILAPLLASATEDPLWVVRDAAVRALAHLRDPKADAVVSARLKDTSGVVRRTAEEVHRRRARAAREERAREDERGALAAELAALGERVPRSLVARVHRAATVELSRAASMAAHDVRSALTVVRSKVERVRRELKNHRVARATWDPSLTEALQGCELIQAICQDLAEFARPGPVEMARVDLRETLADAIRLVEERLPDSPVELQLDVEGDLVCDGHALGLARLLHNVLRNAYEAIAEAARHGTVRVVARGMEDHVSITVEDDGPGVPEEHLRRVFDMFFSTKNTRRGTIDNTGLGLTIALKVVHEHGGHIELRSRAPRGAAMSITLPRDHGVER